MACTGALQNDVQGRNAWYERMLCSDESEGGMQ